MQTVITITHNDNEADVLQRIHAETGNKMLAGLKLQDCIRQWVSGIRQAKIKVGVNAAKASGTITLSSHVATDTVTVNGIAFTCVASGATGNQYNVGASDTLTAVELAAALNANTTLDGMIVATADTGVVTVTALNAGELGNAVTLAISGHGTVSAARLAGGTNGVAEKTHYYGSAT